jgi:serine/threonine protein kinase
MNLSTDPFLGKVIRGYRLEELLGRGAMTAVYRARTQRRWQVAEFIITIVLVPETLPKQVRRSFQERFLQEIGQIERLHHPNICPIYGYGEQDGYCYLLSPALDGKTLLALMRERKRWGPQEILCLLIPIANAFEYLHNQGLVWQFFNPANVIFLNDATISAEPIQLTGLGLLSTLRMKALEGIEVDTSSYEHLKSIAGTYLGAPEYLAPEIVKGSEGDERSDIYSLGILLFNLLSGSPPFCGASYLEIAQKHVYELLPSLHELAPDLPAALELVINRALQRHPDFRYQCPGELVAAYMHIINDRLQPSMNLDISRKVLGLPPLPTPTFSERLRLSPATQSNNGPSSYETIIREVMPPITPEVSGLPEVHETGEVYDEATSPVSSQDESSPTNDAATELTPSPEEESGEDIHEPLSSLKEVTSLSHTQTIVEDEEEHNREEQAAAPSEEEAVSDELPESNSEATQEMCEEPEETIPEEEPIEDTLAEQNAQAIAKKDMNIDIAAMTSQIQQLKERLQAQSKTQPVQSAKPEATSPEDKPEDKKENVDSFPTWLN